MSRYILLFLLIVSTPDNPQVKAPPLRPVEQDIADVSGYYSCKGNDTGGKKYTGVVILTRKADVYMIQWMLSAGGSFTGVAIREGDKLSAAWALPKEEVIVRGVNVYRIEATASGPRLTGRWSSIPGNGKQQAEVLTFLKKLDLEEE